MTDNINDNLTKLYSKRAITIATYFGGPIAAGILVRKNFINLGKPKHGKYSLYIGIISTILLFIGIFSIPEDIIDQIPNMLIPLSYTAIIWAIVSSFQGQDLKKHKENNGQFYSAWKAAGIGAINMVAIFICIFAFILYSSGGFSSISYSLKMEEFQNNEAKAIAIGSNIDFENTNQANDILLYKVLPLWKKNLEIVNYLDKNEDFDNEQKNVNKKLIEYSKLKIELIPLIAKSIKDSTMIYNVRIDEINNKLNELAQ